MQSGNLSLLHLLKRLFLLFLQKITGLNLKINDYNIAIFHVKASQYDIRFDEVLIKELNPLYVLVKEKKFDLQLDIKGLNSLIKPDVIKFNTVDTFDSKIKWLHTNLHHICTNRTYNTEFDVAYKNLEWENISAYTPECHSFSYDEIRITEKIRIFEELISIQPYIKQAVKSAFLSIPAVKKPLYKSYFSLDEMEYFKETLARQNKTKPSNVHITNIYDKFFIELFSSIKQEPATKNLACYYNENNNPVLTDNNYYLIVGERKDNKVSIKSLAKLSD